jgi:hypothetical protein
MKPNLLNEQIYNKKISEVDLTHFIVLNFVLSFLLTISQAHGAISGQ